MQSSTFIKTALEYMDSQYDLHSDIYELLNIHAKYIYLSNENVISFYDKNKNKIYQSKFQIIGKYNKSTSLWYWAWYLINNNQEINILSKRLLMYGMNNTNDVILKKTLITPFIEITNMITYEIMNAIACYLLKIQIIYYFDININIEKYIKNDNINDYININNAKDLITFDLQIFDEFIDITDKNNNNIKHNNYPYTYTLVLLS